MAAPPLTHHEILALVRPFSERGLHVDLAATDRLQRRVVFKPVQHAADGVGGPACAPPAALQDTLQLEAFKQGRFRLTRTLTHPSGLQAMVQALGTDVPALLARVQALPAQGQFRVGAGWVLAFSHNLDSGAAVLSRGVVQAQGLQLVMTLSPVRGVAAEITLTPTPAALDLPQDLLAVLGWDWARLVPEATGWRTRLRLRGGLVRRTRTAERALETVAAHLAGTLAAPPAQFHDQHRRARYGAMLRRAIPLLTPVALAATVISLPRFEVTSSPTWLLLYHVPTLLIALAFRLQELPQLEFPPRPRRSLAPDWRRPAATGRL